MNNLAEELRYIYISMFKINKLYITKNNNDTTVIELDYSVDSEIARLFFIYQQ